jgi:hypothetical protein
MKIENLLRADVSDIASRGWQEIWRTMDRLAVGGAVPAGARSLPLFGHLTPQSVARLSRRSDGTPQDPAQAEFEHFLRHGAVRFFAGPGDAALPAFFEQRLPDARARIIAAAEALCGRSFSLLGHRALFLDEPLDWHRDAVSGQRAPLVHWSRINPLDSERVGDSKVTWELNRHQWLVHLGQAYRLTGEERYADIFVTSVQDWMKQNPAGMGINWASSLEVSYRLISWCWALNLFRGSAALTPRLYVQMLGWLKAHASHVERYLSHYFSPNTHLTGEALGLFYAGALFPDLPRAPRWRKLGMKILLQQLPRQVHEDGVYFEQSTCYQRYTAEIYLHFLILAARNDITVPEAARVRVSALLDSLLAQCRPDGGMPQIGDSDGGRLLPLAQRVADDCRDVFSLAAAFFKRPDYAWAARGASPEVAWLLGTAGCKTLDALQPAPPAESPSRVYPDGGHVVMRSGWERHAHQMLFDTGPLGCRVSGGHGHADLLSIQCSAFGQAQIVDPGTYCYTGNAHWRDHFRGSAAHSTVVVDRKSQAVPVGPFSWQRRPAAQLQEWISMPEYDYADAEHGAYRRLRDPVQHRRRVLFVKPRYWVVVDDLSGADVHEIELMFQFAPVPVTLGGDGWVRSGGQGGRGLFLRAFSSAALQADVEQGGVDPIRGWISPDYGLRVPAPQLTYTAVEKLPLRIVTLIIPREADEGAPPEVESVQTGSSLNLVFTRDQETVRVDDTQITVDGADGSSISPLNDRRET